MTKEQFIQKLLSSAVEAGISEAEAYFSETESMRVLMDQQEIGEYSVNTTGRLMFRGLYNGKMGTSYTEAMDENAIEMLIHQVKASAELITDEDEQFIFAGSSNYVTIDCTGDLGTPEERIQQAMAIAKAGVSNNPYVKENGLFTGFSSESRSVFLSNTHGLNLRHTSQDCYIALESIARDGERASTSFQLDCKRNMKDLDIQKVVTGCIEDAVGGLHAEPCESGEMPVIFRGDAMVDLLGAFHSIFSADAAQKGLSLLAGKEGESVASACVTIVDDPLRIDCMSACPFDDEGVAARTKHVIKKGVLKTLLHNLKTAKKAGCESTGNATRQGRGAIGVAPTNFYLTQGNQDLLALENSMREGIVITRLDGLHAGTDAISGDFSILSKGYMIRDGKRSQAIEKVTVAGNFFTLLKEIVAVGSDLCFPFGNFGSPSVWVSKLSVAGK